MENLLGKASKALALSGISLVNAANAAGLDTVSSATNTFRDWLTTYVPVLAVVGLIVLGIGYALHFIRKEQLGPFIMGCLIVGLLMPGF